MTARHPQRLCDALPAVLAVWQDETGQIPPAALMCAAPMPDNPTVLCARIACTGDHRSDGGDHWTDPEETS